MNMIYLRSRIIKIKQDESQGKLPQLRPLPRNL